MRFFLPTLVLASLFLHGTEASAKRHSQSALDTLVFDYEFGLFAILQNDGRYGDEGTDFDVRDTNQRENLLTASRLSTEIGWGKHTFVLLYAPLDVSTNAVLDSDLRFRDQSFAAGSSINHRYLFDGYRASYTYTLLDSSLKVQLGPTLQMRNAKVAFSQADGSDYVEESDIGLVPAIKVRLRYNFGEKAYLMLDADGLSTFGLVGDTSGGIYDVGLTLGLPLSKSIDFFIRARAVGGGAEVPSREIENFAHFAFVGGGLRVDVTQLD